MAGIILNGSVIKGLILNGSPVIAMLNGVKVFHMEEPGPSPSTELLYEQAVQNYYTQNGMVTIMSGRTWDTDKNFICYKINLKINGDTLGSGSAHGRGVQVSEVYGEGDSRFIKCGRLVDSVYYNTVPKNTSFIQCYAIGTATTGSAGQSFTGDWNITTTYRANPNLITTDAVTYKYVFDIAQHKAYCYIESSLVCIIDFGTYTPYTWDLTTEYGSVEWGCALSADCGIQVYACDSLEAAEAL